jgi:lipoic acid synthetase
MSSRFLPKPSWLRVNLPHGEKYRFIKEMLSHLSLHTVCEEAHCPNMGECWGGGTATFMIMGDVCTRGCRFCAVKTSKYGSPLDPDEPQKLAKAVRQMELEYVVITSVDRDDLPDQGAAHFAKVVEAVKAQTNALVEVLIPDFCANQEALQKVVNAKPDVIAHNVETVRRLTPFVRDRRAGYDQSLQVLQIIKELAPRMITKSSLMLGIGETVEELEETFGDLRNKQVDCLTLGQYLQPSPKHLPVQKFVSPQEFEALKSVAESYGFLYVASGPLVRSSYRAGEFFIKNVLKQ